MSKRPYSNYCNYRTFLELQLLPLFSPPLIYFIKKTPKTYENILASPVLATYEYTFSCRKREAWCKLMQFICRNFLLLSVMSVLTYQTVIVRSLRKLEWLVLKMLGKRKDKLLILAIETAQNYDLAHTVNLWLHCISSSS